MSTLQLLSYGSTLLAGAVLWILEAIVPYFLNRKRHLTHTLKNFTLAGINILIMLPLGVVTAYVLSISSDWWPGIKALPIESWQHVILTLLLIDLWMYAWHRINHRSEFLWRFHAVHHSDPEMDVSTAWRFHWVEIVMSELLRMPVFVMIGVRIEELLIYNIIMTPIIAFHHSNVNVHETLDQALRWLIPTPHLHRLHHSVIRQEHDTNYGSMLSVWDRLFGSLLEKDGKLSDLSLGLIGETDQNNQKLGALLSRPFKTPSQQNII